MVLRKIIVFSLFIIILIGCEPLETPPEILLAFTFDATQEGSAPDWGDVLIDYEMENIGELDLVGCVLDFIIDCTDDVSYFKRTDKADLDMGQSCTGEITVWTYGREMIDVNVEAVGMDRPAEEEE